MQKIIIPHEVQFTVTDNGEHWTVVRGIITSSVLKKDYKTEKLAAKEVLSWDL